jgi:hypothetical protein
MTLDAETVRQLVAEVVARIQAQTPPAPSTTTPSVPARPVSSAPQPQPAVGLTIADAVITLATVERLPGGTKRALISTKAVITPSAREHARDHGIELMRTSSTAGPATASRPLMIGHADCPADVAPRCAAIARSVPGAQQLPATGLADVVATLAAHSARDGARGVLLSGRPAVAVALANRSAGVRAVTARDPASLLVAITECAANIIVVDPKMFPSGSLDRVCSDFAARDLPSPPTELSTPAHPPSSHCSCQGHAHD